MSNILLLPRFTLITYCALSVRAFVTYVWVDAGLVRGNTLFGEGMRENPKLFNGSPAAAASGSVDSSGFSVHQESVTHGCNHWFLGLQLPIPGEGGIRLIEIVDPVPSQTMKARKRKTEAFGIPRHKHGQGNSNANPRAGRAEKKSYNGGVIHGARTALRPAGDKGTPSRVDGTFPFSDPLPRCTTVVVWRWPRLN